MEQQIIDSINTFNRGNSLSDPACHFSINPDTYNLVICALQHLYACLDNYD